MAKCKPIWIWFCWVLSFLLPLPLHVFLFLAHTSSSFYHLSFIFSQPVCWGFFICWVISSLICSIFCFRQSKLIERQVYGVFSFLHIEPDSPAICFCSLFPVALTLGRAIIRVSNGFSLWLRSRRRRTIAQKITSIIFFSWCFDGSILTVVSRDGTGGEAKLHTTWISLINYLQRRLPQHKQPELLNTSWPLDLLLLIISRGRIDNTLKIYVKTRKYKYVQHTK